LIEVPPALAPARTSYSFSVDFDILTEIYRKFLAKAVDDKIKQMFFLYLAVRFGGFHILPKQTLPLSRCDRLILSYG